MMASLKDDAIGLAEALNTLESDYSIPTNNPFHQQIRAALHTHADVLGLDADDLAEIEAAGQAARGGGPKDPA